ncbi:MAG: hypothetical protein ACRC9L_03465, partial [Brevinema sp.]
VANPEEVVEEQLSQDETVDIAVAATKYQAREDLTKAEYDALRQPVPDWDTFNRLVRVEDGFDDLRRFYLDTNTIAPNLNWLDIVYYDPQKESYYYGKFKPTNIEGFDDLINTKKNPAHQVYGRDRVVLITNLSPSTHIYADAYNNYQLYALELKSTIDNYGKSDGGQAICSYFSVLEEGDDNHVVWKTFTNHTAWYRIIYYAVTNNYPVVPPVKTEYITHEEILAELANTNKEPVIVSYGGKDFTIPYTEETKILYYGAKYDFYGDIAELTNENPPMLTRYATSNYNQYGDFYMGDPSGDFIRVSDGIFWFPIVPD